MSLSTTPGAGASSSSSTCSPDSLALARANMSYGEPPGDPFSDEIEGLLSLSSEFSSRIVEPLYGWRFVGVALSLE